MAIAHHKPRPEPLRLLQIAAQTDESRCHGLALDAYVPLSSPVYPFDGVAVSDHSPCKFLDSLPPTQHADPSVPLSPNTHHWNDSSDSHGDLGFLHSPRPYRSFTPPISPPAPSPPGLDTGYPSKRSGMTFALVPTEVDGKHVFTHVVVNHQHDSVYKPTRSSSPSDSAGLPEDMKEILRQLDDLATWIKAASASRDCISRLESVMHAKHPAGYPGTDAAGDNHRYPSDEPFLDKGKNRLLPPSPLVTERGTCQDFVESSKSVVPGNSVRVSLDPPEGFIYMPDSNTPEFLVGSSNSPIAYPVGGYSSHPSRYLPRLLGPTHDVPYNRRFLERRSAPCPPRSSPLLSPPSGKASFKAWFQRSRCNTTAVLRPSIPSGHVPVENVFRQGKRTRLPWLKV